MARPAAEDIPIPAPDDEELSEAEQRSLAEDLKLLLDDGGTLLKAELAYQKARGIFAADTVRSIALFGAIAALLVVLSLMGLTVGLIMALAPLLTIWGSTAVVAGGLLIVAWLLISAAARRWNRMTAALSDEEPGP